MTETVGFVAITALAYGSFVIVTAIHMPLLAAQFRRRLRDALALSRKTQTALSTHIKLDGGQVSRILKFDYSAGQVTLSRLEAIAEFVGEMPSNLVRASDEEPVTLSPIELELLDLIRLLPDEQKGLLVKWLAFVFPERQSAAKERALIRALNLHRQHEREREAEEVKQLKKQLRGKDTGDSGTKGTTP